MRDLKMTDFPTYLWETLDVYQDNSYCYRYYIYYKKECDGSHLTNNY